MSEKSISFFQWEIFVTIDEFNALVPGDVINLSEDQTVFTLCLMVYTLYKDGRSAMSQSCWQLVLSLKYRIINLSSMQTGHSSSKSAFVTLVFQLHKYIPHFRKHV